MLGECDETDLKVPNHEYIPQFDTLVKYINWGYEEQLKAENEANKLKAYKIKLSKLEP